MSSQPPLVLVFDRDARTRAWYRDAFASADYRMAEAAEGPEAVALLTSRLPDLVVAELRRNHRDGLTLCIVTRSTAATADIPVLLVMFDSDPDVEAAALLVGGSAVLAKPRTETAVLSAASRLILGTPQANFTRRHLHRTLADLRQNAGTHAEITTLGENARELLTHVASEFSSIVLANDDAKCMAVNAAACQLTGYTESELLARSLWDLARPDAHPRARLLWDRFLAGGECTGEFQMVRKDGSEVTIQVSGVSNIAPGLHATVADREPVDMESGVW
jgi:PAS domain S-box-containing protein